MHIYVYAHVSQCRRFFDQELAYVAQRGGSAQCDDVEHSQPKKKRKPNPGSSFSIDAPPAANTPPCRGSCAEPGDCSAQHSCLCESDKGIPLSSTCSTVTCMLVANAVVVLSLEHAHCLGGRGAQGEDCAAATEFDDVLRCPDGEVSG